LVIEVEVGLPEEPGLEVDLVGVELLLEEHFDVSQVVLVNIVVSVFESGGLGGLLLSHVLGLPLLLSLYNNVAGEARRHFPQVLQRGSSLAVAAQLLNFDLVLDVERRLEGLAVRNLVHFFSYLRITSFHAGGSLCQFLPLLVELLDVLVFPRLFGPALGAGRVVRRLGGEKVDF